MFRHVSLPSFSAPATSRRLAGFLALIIAATPAVTLASPGDEPAKGGVPVPISGLANAALIAGMGASQKPSLREEISRDSNAIKHFVYNSDRDQSAGQRRPYELSLLDAVELALRNNLNVQVARFNPQSSFHSITSSRAQFDPQLSFNIPQSFNRGSSPTTVQTAGGDVISQQRLSGGFSWQENLEWGTSYGVQWSGTRSSSNNEFSTFNPSLSSGFSGNISQELLRGFGDINRTGIRVAMNSYDQSLESFRSQVQGIINNVVQAYWSLRGQQESLRVGEDSLRLAQQQLERNRIQVEIGTLAPIETVQAETSVARNELALLRTRNTLENAQDAVKELVNFDAIVDDPFAYDLVATENPEESVPSIDAEEAVAEALENDPGLRQQRIALRSAELSLRQARNGLLPSLRVTGSFNLQGRAGTRIVRSGGLGGEELEIIETGFGTALGQVLSGDFNSWTLGASLTIPLHNYQAKANAAQAEIGEQRTMTQYEQLRQQIVYDVRQQVRNVENLVRQVETSAQQREFAERQYEAEQRKFEVGSSTNFTVLEFQSQLSQAQLDELTAIFDLQGAIATLELTKGTLLEYFGVQLGDAGTGGGREDELAPLPEPTGGR